MMIYFKLFLEFLIVGTFSFGGAYSAIPLAKDAAEKFYIFNDQMIADFVAISESTPGSVGVNIATFIGTTVAGIPGAITATVAEVLPAFVIMLIFSMFFVNGFKNKKFQFILSVIRPSVIGIIMSVGVFMLLENTSLISFFTNGFDAIKSIKSLIIAIVLFIAIIIYKSVTKKSLGTIKIILFGAFLGIAINHFI